MSHSSYSNSVPNPGEPFDASHPDATWIEELFLADEDFSGLPTIRPLEAQNELTAGDDYLERYRKTGDAVYLDRAAECYRQAMVIAPKNAEAYIKLGSALWTSDKIDATIALDMFRKALDLSPSNPEGRLMLAHALYHCGEEAEAIDELRTLIGDKPLQSAKARLALSHILTNPPVVPVSLVGRLGRWAAGSWYAASALLVLPWSKEERQALVQAIAQDVHVHSLLTVWNVVKVSNIVPLQLATLRWASNRAPEQAIFPHLLGDACRKANRLEDAVAAYEAARAITPSDTTLLKKLGDTHMHRKDYAPAVKILEQLLETHGEDQPSGESQQLRLMLAHAYTEAKYYMGALFCYRTALNSDPENPYIHSNLAYILLKLEDASGAMEEYKHALDIARCSPSRVDATWTSHTAQILAQLYQQVGGNITGAMELYELSCKLDSGNLASVAGMADIYCEQGDYEMAIELYSRLLQYEPDNADAHTYVGYLHWQLGHIEEAEAAYRKAIHFNPNNALACNNLGVILLDEYQDPEGAKGLFEHALECQPDYALACFNIGRVHEMLGDVRQAAKAYSQALELNVLRPELDPLEITSRLDSLFKVS